MPRTISRGLSGLLEELELEQPTLVTLDQLAVLVQRHELRTPPRIVAARLRDEGWLLTTGRQGVYEFAPAAVAGAYSRNDPLTSLRAFLLRRPGVRCGLTLQSAAWAHGLADRVPSRPEVAAATSELARQLPDQLAASVFDPHLDYETLRGVPVLPLASVAVHMAARPAAVRSWASALEWLPDLAHELDQSSLRAELSGRPTTVQVRAGYLLQGLRPDLSEDLRSTRAPSSKTWFGPRGPLKRHDANWLVADTLLPFDPRALESVA